MSLVKTEKGKQALQNRDPGLSPRERQLLILANGTRSRSAMAELMERSAAEEIDRLIATGYLLEVVVRPKPTTAPEPAIRLPEARPPAVVTPLGASQAKAVPVQQQALSRRSLAGTKMYIIDMLQLMRDMDASSLAVSLHTSQSESEFVGNVIDAVRFITAKSGASYGMRVVAKLQEIIPEPHIAAIDELAMEMDAGRMST